MENIFKSIAGILFSMILCNSVSASTIYKNKQILRLDGLKWDTAYEDAYKIYEKSTDQELNKEIEELQNNLSKIKIKDENGKVVQKYYIYD